MPNTTTTEATDQEFVLVLDADLRLSACSPAPMGSTASELTTRFGDDVVERCVHPDDRDDAVRRLRAVLGGAPSERGVVRVRMGGALRRCSVIARPIVSRTAPRSIALSVRLLDDSSPQVDLGELSEREREILGLVAQGYRVATIARSLGISASTVRNHLSAIFRKFGVRNQAQLLELLRDGASL